MQEFSGIEYIMIDIANQFGNGIHKKTFKQRIKWVHQHRHELAELQDDAKNTPRYMAALIAYQDAQNGEPTGHLVGFDANASGCQMMAILMGCPITAKNTGLIGNKQMDLYTETTKEMSTMLGQEVDIDRELVKGAQMP